MAHAIAFAKTCVQFRCVGNQFSSPELAQMNATPKSEAARRPHGTAHGARLPDDSAPLLSGDA